MARTPARRKEERRLTCTVCGDLVIESDLREHLVLHHPNARGMDWEDVRNVFVEGSAEGE